jgi:serine/threonine protein kinase
MLPINEKSDPGHTDSTLRISPAKSPKNQCLMTPSPASPAPSQFNRTKVDELIQVLEVDQLLQGTGEELTDSSIVVEGSMVSKNHNTLVNRVKVRGLLLAKKIFKYSPYDETQYKAYSQEVEVLQHLARKPHWHVILLLRHYTDLEGRGCLLLSPLAQMTLQDFLSEPPSQESRQLVRLWLGCLACGLAYLHLNKIKHKNIKPSNILIHGANPIIADRGISHRFNDDSKISGRSWGSETYAAPEVLEEEIRGRRQDVWSLLCCYIEILAFLKGMDRKTFHKSMKLGGYCGSYYSRHSFIVDWLNSLKPSAADEDELTFIQLLLDSFKTNPDERPYARGLAEQIQAIGEQRPHKYIGKCCAVDDTSNDFSILNASQSTLPKPEDFEKGSLLHFVAGMARSLDKNAIPGAYSSLTSLYRQVSNGKICSIRSAEQEFLLMIAPVRLLSIPV